MSLLELRGITKRYPAVVANDDIHLKIEAGTIHAILGENGAGKSTLMKIIYGATAANEGQIYWHGNPVRISSPAAARRLGIGMVYQHFSLFESITVAENIAIALDRKLNLEALSTEISVLSEKYNLLVEPDRLLYHLSVGERQRVEIIRCLIQNPKLLILDEPTSVLTPQAIQGLFVTLKQLASEGCSILYISHKLEEIFQICDSATVLRGGKIIDTILPSATTTGELAHLMIGTQPPTTQRQHGKINPSSTLEIYQLSAPAEDHFGSDIRHVSLTVQGGEIIGIAGVSGNGQAELFKLLSGEKTHSEPDAIRINDVGVSCLNANGRRQLGLACIPEERLGRGAAAGFSLRDNFCLTHHGRNLLRYGFIKYKEADKRTAQVIDRFSVLCDGPSAAAESLSGGNLQRFIVGREIELNPTVLIVSQPTWGLDVAAAAFIRQTLIDLSRSGSAVLIFSEELEELLEICDHIAVMYAGQISTPVPRSDADIEHIGLLMAGEGFSIQATPQGH